MKVKRDKTFYTPPLLSQIQKVDTSSLKGGRKPKCENIKVQTHELNISIRLSEKQNSYFQMSSI